MDADEHDIFHFLKTWGADYTSAMEICRRAGNKRRFQKDPNWAKPILLRMVERGILESDIQGRFRVKPVSRKKRGNRWVSPDIAKILQDSGVEVENTGSEGEIADDEYYDKL